MTPELFELMRLQGDIKAHLIRMGLEQALSHAVAAEAVDKFLKSKVARQEYQDAYGVFEQEHEERAKTSTIWDGTGVNPLADLLTANRILLVKDIHTGAMVAWECPTCHVMNKERGLIGVTCQNCTFSISFPELEGK